MAAITRRKKEEELGKHKLIQLARKMILSTFFSFL